MIIKSYGLTSSEWLNMYICKWNDGVMKERMFSNKLC